MSTKKQSIKKETKKVVAKAPTKKVTKTKAATAKHVKKVVKTKRTSKSVAASKPVEFAKKTKFSGGHHMKKWSYKILSLILGLLAASFVHLFVEFAFLKKAFNEGSILADHSILGFVTFVPVPLTLLIFAIGIYFGFWLGSWGWKIVYIEGRRS